MQPPPDLDATLAAVRAWGERAGWAGWDPYDALNSPFAHALTLDRPLGRRLLTQVVKTSPLNLRPLLRVPKERDAKAVGLLVSAYARLGDDPVELVEWLLEHPARTVSGLAWGYHFDVQTRFLDYRRGSPNVIATAFVAHGLLDAIELVGREDLVEPVRRVCAFLTDELRVDGPVSYFRYVPGADELVHNANLLACGVLFRASAALADEAPAESARGPLRTGLAAQRADGSWPYTATARGGWVDNLHTAYVLESLAHCAPGDSTVLPHLIRGVDHWSRALFLADGTPRASTRHVLPFATHDCAQAIETWLAVRHWYPEARARAERLARILVERMLDPRGFFRVERRRFWTSSIPFVRWTTAPAFRALAGLDRIRARTPLTGRPAHARVD